MTTSRTPAERRRGIARSQRGALFLEDYFARSSKSQATIQLLFPAPASGRHCGQWPRRWATTSTPRMRPCSVSNFDRREVIHRQGDADSSSLGRPHPGVAPPVPKVLSRTTCSVIRLDRHPARARCRGLRKQE